MTPHFAPQYAPSAQPRRGHAVFRLVAAACGTAGFLMLTGCASKPEAPIIAQLSGLAAAQTALRLDALLPAEVLLLGEQHDAAEHQKLAQQVIANLASRGVLGAVVLEMADAGVTTAQLHPSSNEDQARLALRWKDDAWPWAAYGPAVMTAVRAGVPVMGANLPRSSLRASMADGQLDTQLPGPALKAQQQLIRIGHCNLLPEAQITPMTRVQIARDISMAATLAHAAVPGKVAVLMTGSGHANRTLGVPQHLPPGLQSRTVLMQAGQPENAVSPDAFDAIWQTPALAPTDYCAEFKKQFGAAGAGAVAAP